MSHPNVAPDRRRTKHAILSPAARRLGFAIVVVVGLLVLATMVPAIAFGRTPPAWVPPAVRTWAFDVRLTVAPPLMKVESITQGSFRDDRLYLDRYGESVHFQSGELRIAGTLYLPDEEGETHPGVLIVHGSTPEGRKLGLYRLLGQELARRGYVALTIDQRGFGDSDDPQRVDRVTALSSVSDVGAALDYLASLDVVDSERLYVIGHSAGADPAVTAGIEDRRVEKIVAIGPPRRVEERLKDHEELAYFQRRMTRYMNLAEMIPAHVLLELSTSENIAAHTDYFARAGHKPVLFIDGALENEQDRLYLQQFCAAAAEPKKCITLSNADHYANVANVGPIIFFDRRVVGELINEIDVWLAEEDTP